MDKEYFSTKEAARMTGASPQIIRTYTARYARFLSTEATPEPGQARRFTEADLRLIAFIYQQTGVGGQTHEQVMEQLVTGELEHFEWQPRHQERRIEAQEAPEEPSTALVPVERLQAAQVLLQDAQRRETEAKNEASLLRERIEQLQRDLGEAHGELNAYRRLQPKRPRWWLWLFGGSEGER